MTWPTLWIFALHLTHPRCTHTAVNTHTHTHTHTPPEQWAAIYGTFLPVQDSNSQLFDYESNSLTIRPQLLQSQCHGCRTDFVIEQTLSDRVFTRPDSCRATPRVVTVWDFDGMILVSENITVSWFTVLNNQNSFFFWLTKCLEACAYLNFVNQKQSSKFNHWLYISLTTYIHH